MAQAKSLEELTPPQEGHLAAEKEERSMRHHMMSLWLRARNEKH